MPLLNLIKKILQNKLIFLYAVVDTNGWLYSTWYRRWSIGLYQLYFLALIQADKKQSEPFIPR